MAKVGPFALWSSNLHQLLKVPGLQASLGTANHECPWGGFYPLALSLSPCLGHLKILMPLKVTFTHHEPF